MDHLKVGLSLLSTKMGFNIFVSFIENMLSKIYINGFWISVAVLSKIGHHFRKESLLKIEFNQNISIKKWAPKLILLTFKKSETFRWFLTFRFSFHISKATLPCPHIISIKYSLFFYFLVKMSLVPNVQAETPQP